MRMRTLTCMVHTYMRCSASEMVPLAALSWVSLCSAVEHAAAVYSYPLAGAVGSRRGVRDRLLFGIIWIHVKVVFFLSVVHQLLFSRLLIDWVVDGGTLCLF
jgi:hypothetical protein